MGDIDRMGGTPVGRRRGRALLARQAKAAVVVSAFVLSVVVVAVGGAAATPSTSITGWDTATIDLPTTAGAFDPAHNKVLVTVPPTVPGLGNQLVEIDPTTGARGRSVAVGAQPISLAVADDGSRAYVGLAGAGSVTEVDLATFTVTRSISLGRSTFSGTRYAGDIVVQPGNPGVIAVVRDNVGISPSHEGVAIFDNGVERPTSTSSHTGPSQLAWTDDPGVMYGVGSSTLYKMTVSASGVSMVSTSVPISSAPDLAFVDGQLISSNGKVVRTSDLTLVGSYTSSGSMAFDPDNDRAYFLNGSSLTSHDSTSLLQIASRSVPSVSPFKLVATDAGLVALGATKAMLIGPGVSGSAFTRPPGPSSKVQMWSARTANVDVQALAAAPAGDHLYGVVRQNAAARPGELVELDPVTGAVTRSLFVGADPTELAVSDDGSTVMVGHYASGQLTEVDAATLSVRRTIPLGGPFVGDIAARPGDPDAFAVVLESHCCSPALEGIVLVDGGVILPDAGPGHTGATDITFAGNPGEVYGHNGGTTDYGFYTLDVDATGVRARSSATRLITGFGLEVEDADGLVYASSGRVVDPTVPEVVGTVTSSGQPVAVPDQDRLLMVSGGTINEFDLDDYSSVASQAFTGGSTRDATLVGSTLAIATTSAKVVLISVGDDDRPAPSVTALSPATSPTAGGGQLTITGAGLTWATTVSIDGASVPFTVVDDSTIKATIPAHAGGVVPVTVTSPRGTSSGGPTLTYVAAVPAITSLWTPGGPVTGGNQVAITGTGLSFATAVTFGSVPATSFVQISDQQIWATAPPGTAGDATIAVTTAGGTSAPSAGSTYTYTAAVPAVTRISPNSGLTTTQQTVEITGSGFFGATKVEFGTKSASYQVISDSSIRAVSPTATAAGTVKVRVTTGNGSSATTGVASSYSYTDPPPVIDRLSPAAGPTAGGNLVIIDGSWLQGAVSVRFGTASASFSPLSSGRLLAVAPPGAPGTVAVRVTTSGGTTAAAAATYRYGNAPTITSLAPASGSTRGGTVVSITGTGFTGTSGVLFGDDVVAPVFEVVSDTQLEVISPAHRAGTVEVTVVTPFGPVTSPDDFEYLPELPGVPALAPPTQQDGVVSIQWTAPGDDGGSDITGYVVTPIRDGVPQAPIDVAATPTATAIEGLTKGASYRFTIAATNAKGTGATSSPSAAVVPVSLPTAPTIGVAAGGNGQALVRWTAPGDSGGSPITGYVVTPTVAGVAQAPIAFDASVTAQPVLGLTNGVTYTFTVAARTAIGTGPASPSSNTVVPSSGAPIANAGPDQAVATNAPITLDASGSTDPDSDPLTYEWVQISGPMAVIVDPTQKFASVNPVANDSRLVFRVTVTDSNGLVHTDTVLVTVGRPK